MNIMSLINWVKTHKLVVLLLLIIAYLYFRDNPIVPLQKFTPSVDYYRATPLNAGIAAPELSLPPESAPLSYNQDRIVTKTSDLSLVVKDVRQKGDQIISYAKSIGGFMVFASYNRPTESPFANVTIRVPTDRLDEALAYIRSLAVKVTSENLVGTDVTDEYLDIEARLATLRKTQARFEEILEKATDVQDILIVTREIINLQQQIDSLIGQNNQLKTMQNLPKLLSIYPQTNSRCLMHQTRLFVPMSHLN